MGFFSSVRNLFRSEPSREQPAEQAAAKGREEASLPSESASEEPERAIPPQAEAQPGVQGEVAVASSSQVDLGPTHLDPADSGQPFPGSAGSASPVADQPQAAEAAAAIPEETQLTLALRQAEPKLSAWLGVILEGVEGTGELLWQRLKFLLSALETPPAEADSFIDSFRRWLSDMGYAHIDDFRSELQYRLALALDLEDEEDEKSRLVQKITQGLAKTRESLARNLDGLFSSGRQLDESFWEELEEILLVADVGFEAAQELARRLRARAARESVTDAENLKGLMREELLQVFKPPKRIVAVNPPEVILVIGVNGVGKTTTIAKLSHRAVMQGKRVMLVAADTFRAAATEQLEIWAKRTGASFYAKGHGADPAAVAYEAMDRAMSEGCDTVFVDTAGRLHTKANLMEELDKIRRVLSKRHPGAPHRTILILDSTTGQNGLSQVKLFNEGCGIDDIVLTKLDGTAKGGIAVAVAMQFNIPISFVGLGEKMEDLRPFDAEAFVNALL